MLPRRNSPGRRHRPAATLATLAALAAALSPAAPAAASPSGADVTFGTSAHPLHGTVVEPPGTRAGRLPAMVLVAGAGPTRREAYRREAEAFARAGIVVLIYDKRTGYSRATTSFSDLADDALSGVELLRRRPEVDPARVGLWGYSQGGWVVPLAASRTADVAFVIAVSASGLRPG